VFDGVRFEAAGSLRTRASSGDRDARGLAGGAWLGPAVQHRAKGSRTFQDIAFLQIGHAEGMQKSGWRHIALWADSGLGTPLAVIETEAAEGERAVYRITDGSGMPLARVTRVQGSIAKFRRTRWTVETTAGPTLRAVKGRVFGWCVFWLFSPLWLVIALGSIAGGDVWRMPVDTVWRHDGRPVLQLASIETGTQDFSIRGDWPDARLLVALAALQHTHLPWRDRV
jgi:hypothetical protein